MVVVVILIQLGERRINVQYAKRVQGRKVYGGQSTHIPLKVNMAGVIPVIFASSLLQFPLIVTQFFVANPTGLVGNST
jgi:preprotein translocase subunit SecY